MVKLVLEVHCLCYCISVIVILFKFGYDYYMYVCILGVEGRSEIGQCNYGYYVSSSFEH